MRSRFIVSVVVLVLSALAIAGCRGGKPDSGLVLADRWLRVGEDRSTNVIVYDHALPPDLPDMLNPDATEGTAASDRVSLPVYPQAALLGSYHLRRADGSNLLWLVYDVTGDGVEIAKTVAQQLNQSPWQVVGGQGNEGMDVIRFLSTRISDLDGSAVVQENPSTPDFRLTVVRAGKDTVLTVKRSAPAPSLGATFGADLSVTSVDSGPARTAGLRAGDRISRVNDTQVNSAQTLETALHGLAASGQRRVSVTYVVQIKPSLPPSTAAFVAPAVALQLPAGFPAPQAWQGLTVTDFAWGTQQGGKAFQASMVSKEGSATVVNRLRDGLKAAGWEITGDTPAGFATRLDIARRADGYAGQVQIDALPGDSAYIQVVVQIQAGAAAGK